jgi:hypothetical protein
MSASPVHALTRNKAAVAPTSKALTRSRISAVYVLCGIMYTIPLPASLPFSPHILKKLVCKTELVKHDKLNGNAN